MQKKWGFDTRDIDVTIRPQDDFYQYANGGWLKRNPIPPHESRWGSFLILRYDTERKLQKLIRGIARNLKVGSLERKVHDFYRSGLDTKHRNALGITPLLAWLNRIEKIRDVPSLVSMIGHFEKIGRGGPWGITVDQDMKNSNRYIIYIHQNGLGMPDRDYYIKKDSESLRVRMAYKKHIETMLILTGATKSEAEKFRNTIMRIETSFAEISMPKEELRDVDRVYHKVRTSSLMHLTPHIDWNSYLKIVGAGKVREVVVMQPKFIKAIDAMLVNESIDNWKTYLTWQLINGTASYLSEKFEKQNFSFYGMVLSGTKIMKPTWRRVLRVVNGNLGEALGKLYVRTYFSHEAKQKIIAIVDDLFEAYEARIKNLDWMDSSTKRKALKKLHQMTRKLGYPNKWRSYKGLKIKPDDYFGNVVRATMFEHAFAMRRLKKPVDRKEWFMAPQTVNAYCSFGLNDVVFPAAILQPPFFSINADDAVNYGGIGTVIGHEITHGFDDQGCKFDGRGNRITWWTRKDHARFTKKAAVLIKEFNAYEIDSTLKVNGQLTLGENIADLGGVSIAYDAYKLRLEKTVREDIDGFTPEQRFFLSFALFERENSRPEAEKTQVLTDPHSPGRYRINGPASNLPEFYEAFNVKRGDKLYRESGDRAKIW